MVGFESLALLLHVVGMTSKQPLRACAAAVIALLVATAPATASPAVTCLHDRVTIDAHGVDVNDVLQSLASACGGLVEGARMPPRPISLSLHEVTVPDAVARIVGRGRRSFVVRYGRTRLRAITLLSAAGDATPMIELEPPAREEAAAPPILEADVDSSGTVALLGNVDWASLDHDAASLSTLQQQLDLLTPDEAERVFQDHFGSDGVALLADLRTRIAAAGE